MWVSAITRALSIRFDLKWSLLSKSILTFLHTNKHHLTQHPAKPHITHIQDIHNMAGSLVPYNHAHPKRGLIHRDRESSVIRTLLYLQATTAGSSHQVIFITIEHINKTLNIFFLIKNFNFNFCLKVNEPFPLLLTLFYHFKKSFLDFC